MMSKKVIVPLLILLGGGIFFYVFGNSASISVAPTSPVVTSTPPKPIAPTSSVPAAAPKPQAAQGPQVRIGSLSIPVEVARTTAELQKGLSGKLSLDPEKGMLFVFSKPQILTFWMPDMHFRIDMIWISSDKKILGVTANVSNEFDPAKPKYYHPPSPAQYVLEVNAGFAAGNRISAGDSVAFAGI